MNKGLKGTFSVEAAILVPFLLTVTILGMYMAVYVYDRTLMVQDAEAIICTMRMYGTVGNELPGDHPYIAMNGVNVTADITGSEITVSLSGYWTMPVLPSYGREITYKRKEKITDPLEVMYLTEVIRDLEETYGEDQN